MGNAGDAGEHISEPSLRVDIVKLGRRDQRCHDRGAVRSAIRTCEQSGLTSQGKSAQGAFGRVVAKADPAVVDEADKPVPTLEHVVDRLGDRG